jgi:hypothetical protein
MGNCHCRHSRPRIPERANRDRRNPTLLPHKGSRRRSNKDFILNHDHGDVRGGLYRRHPWFGTDAHDFIPLIYSGDRQGRHSARRPPSRPRLALLERVSPRCPSPPELSRAAPSEPASGSLAELCCKSAWITGAIPQSAAAAAATIMKPEPVIGTSPPTTGRMQNSPTLQKQNNASLCISVSVVKGFPILPVK